MSSSSKILRGIACWISYFTPKGHSLAALARALDTSLDLFMEEDVIESGRPAAPAPDERDAPPTLELARIAQVYDHARWYAAITPPHVRAEAVRLLKLTIEALEDVDEE